MSAGIVESLSQLSRSSLQLQNANFPRALAYMDFNQNPVRGQTQPGVFGESPISNKGPFVVVQEN